MAEHRVPIASERPLSVVEAEQRLEALTPGYLERVRLLTGRLGVRVLADGDVRGALATVEDLSGIDVDVPTLSRSPGVRWVKRAVKSLIGWYLRYVGQQVSALGDAVGTLGRALAERAEDLEDRSTRLESELAELTERVERLERRARGQ